MDVFSAWRLQVRLMMSALMFLSFTSSVLAAEVTSSSPMVVTVVEEGGEGDADEFEEYEDDQYAEEEWLQIADPLEGFNRAMFGFNDYFYFYLLKPVARSYGYVVPEPARRGVKNFFYNLLFPIRFTNNLLQAKFEPAGYELFRFLYNTTFGLAGFFNPAKKHPELTPPSEDAGQTFGVWGMGNGLYFVWPFLGPSTARDTLGLIPDYFMNPVSYLDPSAASIGVKGYERVNATSLTIGDYEALKEASLDPYAALKDAYLQYRWKAVRE